MKNLVEAVRRDTRGEIPDSEQTRSLLISLRDLGLGLKPKLLVPAGGPSVLFPYLAGAHCDLLPNASRHQALPQLLLQLLDPRPLPLHGSLIGDTG